jgi:xanthine dehydrogenase small subunit
LPLASLLLLTWGLPLLVVAPRHRQKDPRKIIRLFTGQDTNMTAESRSAIRFVLDGEVIELENVDPTRTVLQFLREDLGRIGTKEGCAEGDCGACTIALTEIDASGKRLQVRAINSCIQFLPTLDGKELITVESLRAADDALHPVQQAMVDWHGSQCGFCTPGFVMSLFALYKNNAKPGRREIDDALAGNLCRCTGYRPIIEAAARMYSDYADRQQAGGWLLEPQAPKSSAGDDEKSRIELLRSLENERSLAVDLQGREFFAPHSTDEMAQLLQECPEATILAGGTDVGLWVTKQHRELDVVIYSGSVDELRQQRTTDSHLEIGAAVSLSDAMQLLLEHYPSLEELFLRFASPPIRNAATLGGNIANGSPIGDTMPALLVLDASLVLRKGAVQRTLPLVDFYIDYMQNALEPGEFIEKILIPLPVDGECVASYKISKRFDQDISAVCGAYRLVLDGGNVADIKVAYGGMAAIPKRATHCESSLLGQSWNEAEVATAMKALGEDFTPLSDMRSTANYRQRTCANLLYRFFLESTEAGEERLYSYGR